MGRTLVTLACLGVLLGALCSSAANQGETWLIVAHRGASDLAPENTLAAFNLAWELGADVIEADFYLTADGHIVAHHDETTKRTAGVNRPVAKQTLAELKKHDVGAWKHSRFAGERIPTLQEVLATIPAGRAIFIEIKTDATIAPALAESIRSSDLDPRQVTVIAFDKEVIASFKGILPKTRALWLTKIKETRPGIWRPTAQQIVKTATRIRADGVDLEARPEAIDEAFIRTLRAAGLEIHVWTVNDAKLAQRMIDLGVDGITTDRPGWLRRFK